MCIVLMNTQEYFYAFSYDLDIHMWVCFSGITFDYELICTISCA